MSYTPVESIQKTTKSFSSVQLKESGFYCGPSFTIYNPSGYTVTSMEITRLGTGGFKEEIFNPTFPYSPSWNTQVSGGAFNFLFYFSNSGGMSYGSFLVNGSITGPVHCESFDTQSMYPFSFWTGCETYSISITSDPTCP